MAFFFGGGRGEGDEGGLKDVGKLDLLVGFACRLEEARKNLWRMSFTSFHLNSLPFFYFQPFFSFIFHSYLQIACIPGLDDNNISSLLFDHLRIKRQIPIYFSRMRVVLIFSSIKFEAT